MSCFRASFRHVLVMKHLNTNWRRRVHAMPASRIESLSLITDEMESSMGYCREALGLRLLSNSSSASAVYGEAAGCCISLVRRSRGPEDTARLPTLRYPYATFGVSNLRTSGRKAKRWFGDVAGENLQPAQGYPACALFFDPTGTVHRVLHLFKRNPVISITLGMTDVARAASFFVNFLGMRCLDGEEAAAERREAHLPRIESAGGRLPLDVHQVQPGARSVLAYGHLASSSCIVIEQRGASADSTPTDKVLTIAVPTLQLQLAFIEISRDCANGHKAWLGVAPLRSDAETAADTSIKGGFLCEDVDGHVFQVLPLEAT